MYVDGVLDGRTQRRDLSDQRPKYGNQRPHTLALRLGLELAGHALCCRAQALDELGGSAPASVAVAREEGSHTFLPQRLRSLRRRIAVEELERDRRIDLA